MTIPDFNIWKTNCGPLLLSSPKFSAQILDMVMVKVIRDFNFEKELKESNCLLDWVSNCKLSLNSLEKDILKQLKQDKFW